MQSLSSYVKKLLMDQYIQNWFGCSTLSSKSMIYFSFKSTFSFEKYLTVLPKKLAINIFRFRTGNHRLPIETGRWDGTDLHDRKCTQCHLNEVGDEFHYLFVCPQYQNIRKQLLSKYYINRPNMIKFGPLLSSDSENILKNLSKLISLIIKSFLR